MMTPSTNPSLKGGSSASRISPRSRGISILLIGGFLLLSAPGGIGFAQSPTKKPSPPKPPAPVKEAAPENPIDRAVFAQLKKLKLTPAERCSDSVFVRRVYLDVIGTLPTAEEAGRFLSDRSAEKRRVLIDALLKRDEYAEYWAMKWCDLLRVKAEFPINLWPNAAAAYHRWIRESLRENKPYDQFVRELLTSSGSNFRVPAVNFYRAVQSRT